MTQAFAIGDKVRLKAGGDSAVVLAVSRFVTGEWCYVTAPSLAGEESPHVGESALERADEPVVSPTAVNTSKIEGAARGA